MREDGDYMFLWLKYVKRHEGQWKFLDKGNGYVPPSRERKKSLDTLKGGVVAYRAKGVIKDEGENGVNGAKAHKGGSIGRWGNVAGIQIILRAVGERSGGRTGRHGGEGCQEGKQK